MKNNSLRRNLKQSSYLSARSFFKSLFSPVEEITFKVSPEKEPEKVFTVKGYEGDNLMDTLNESEIKGLNVFGICDKQLACLSCRVNVEEGYNNLPKPTEEETDILYDLGRHYKDNITRMSCQLKISKALEGAHIFVPRSAFAVFEILSDSD
ncbi:unnamed protein product [Moneuplotes crassus]|uniref:Ferredoxin n=1 Tax=Euplotes crassus TaxID=5936 RepID=A0AAD1U960_EUPCR|nr:unnamed protein product [Moneuplotes crassus]